MSKALSKCGVVKNKSLILSYPEWLPTELQSHFVRGYFDGDGSISFSKSIGSVDITFTSTNDFCNSLKDIISDICPNAYIEDASCHNGITKVLNVCKQKEALYLCDWMYKDAKMFLTRKYDRYLLLKEYLHIKRVA